VRCSSLLFGFVLAILAACGGKSATAGDGGPSNGGTANQAGASGNGAACSSFADEVGVSIGVDLINLTSRKLYLGQPEVTCEVEPLFSVADASGAALPAPTRCRSACSSESGGCVGICLYPAAFALEPGATMSTSWSGLFDVDVELPDACVVGAQRCQQSKRIRPGTFTFTALAGSALRCADDQGCDDGCENVAAGVCATNGVLTAGQTRTASATVPLDATFGVYDDEPTPPGAGAPSSDAVLARVKLVFAD
jgi:hypothetical protein